ARERRRLRIRHLQEQRFEPRRDDELARPRRCARVVREHEEAERERASERRKRRACRGGRGHGRADVNKPAGYRNALPTEKPLLTKRSSDRDELAPAVARDVVAPHALAGGAVAAAGAAVVIAAARAIEIGAVQLDDGPPGVA